MNPEQEGTSTKQKWFLIVGPALILALAIGGIFIWRGRLYESTDDAFIDGHVIPISSKVAGQVVSVFANDNRFVHKDDILVRIDPVPYQVKLLEEQAKLASAAAEAKRAAKDAERYVEIYEKDEISRQQLDDAEAALSSAQAAVKRERAAVEQAQINLDDTKILAPESGTVTRKSVEPGVYVQVGQSLLTLVPEELWVTANFKETQLTLIRPGQPVIVNVDAYPGHELHAHVDSIQSGTGARFSLFPPENATGNFVKVVQRVPVKILFDGTNASHPFLAPGMSAVATVKVR